jgi:chromosome segregation ATPase
MQINEDEYSKEIDVMNKKISSLKSDIVALTAARDEYKAQANEANAKIEEYCNTIEVFEAHFDEMTDQIQKLYSSNQSYNWAVDFLAGSTEVMRVFIEDYVSDRAGPQSSVSDTLYTLIKCGKDLSHTDRLTMAEAIMAAG